MGKTHSSFEKPSHDDECEAVAALSCLDANPLVSVLKPRCWPMSHLSGSAGTPWDASTQGAALNSVSPFQRSQQLTRHCTQELENENASKARLTLFVKKAETLGGMRIHTAGFPQSLPSSAQKLCPKNFEAFSCLSQISRCLIATTDCTALLSHRSDLALTIRRFDCTVARCSLTISWWWFSWPPHHHHHFLRKVTSGDSEDRIIHCTVLCCTLLREICASQTLLLNSRKGGHVAIR